MVLNGLLSNALACVVETYLDFWIIIIIIHFSSIVLVLVMTADAHVVLRHSNFLPGQITSHGSLDLYDEGELLHRDSTF